MIKTVPTSGFHSAAAFLLVVLAVVSPNGVCFAFSDGDFQFWSITGASFSIHKDWTAAVEEHIKFGDNAGHLYYHHTDLGFTYKGLADWVDLGFNYKQVFLELPGGDWITENRPHLNITFKGKLSSLDFSDRSRLEYRDMEHVDAFWRYLNKLEFTLPYEFTRFRFRPYLADQVYINLDGRGFDRNRIYAGVTFELTKDIESELFYVWEMKKFLDQMDYMSALGLQLKICF